MATIDDRLPPPKEWTPRLEQILQDEKARLAHWENGALDTPAHIRAYGEYCDLIVRSKGIVARLEAQKAAIASAHLEAAE